MQHYHLHNIFTLLINAYDASELRILIKYTPQIHDCVPVYWIRHLMSNYT